MYKELQAIKELKSKFSKEAANIFNYSFLLTDNARALDSSWIEGLDNIVDFYKLIDTYKYKSLTDDILIDSEFLEDCYSKAYMEYYIYNNFIEEINKILKVPNAEYEPDACLLDEIDFLYRDLTYLKREKLKNLDNFREFASNSIVSLRGKFCLEPAEEKKVCLYSIKSICQINISEIFSFIDHCSNARLKENMTSESNILNIYRQGFILLIASFDAILFDITRYILKTKFFSYIHFFDNNKTIIKVTDFEKYDMFEEFKKDIIDKCLKGAYSSSIIRTYKTIGISFINDKFINLNECIKRRNVHLHNQGVADKQYVADYNIYSKKIGDLLTINENYFTEVYRLLYYTISSIYDWYESIL